MMIVQVLTASSTLTFPAVTAKYGFEVILRIINNPQNYIPLILGVSVVLIVLPLVGICYAINKLYQKYFPETG